MLDIGPKHINFLLQHSFVAIHDDLLSLREGLHVPLTDRQEPARNIRNIRCRFLNAWSDSKRLLCRHGLDVRVTCDVEGLVGRAIGGLRHRGPPVRGWLVVGGRDGTSAGLQCATQHNDTSFCCRAQELMKDPNARHSRRESLNNAWCPSIGSRKPEVHGLELGWRRSVFANEQDCAGWPTLSANPADISPRAGACLSDLP